MREQRNSLLPILMIISLMTAIGGITALDGRKANAAPGQLSPTVVTASTVITPFQPNIRLGGRAVAVTVHPANYQVAISASESGGLFKTTDFGFTWEHLDALLPFRMADVRFSPDNGNVVLATTLASSTDANRGGIWRSDTGGTTWVRPEQPSCNAGGSAWGIAFMPGTTSVYVGTDCGVAVSHDLGIHWTLLDPDANLAPFGVYAIVAHNNLVDICSFKGHYRLNTVSGAWTSRNDNSPRCIPGFTHAIDVSPFEADVLFMTTLDYRLSETDNGGQTWTPLNTPAPPHPNRIPFVRAHRPAASDLGEVEVFFGNGIDLYYQICPNTTNPDQTRCSTLAIAWARRSIDHFDPADLAYEGVGHVCPALLATDGGMHKTDDCGATWTVTGGGVNGFNALQIYEVTGQVHPDHTDLYFGSHDNDLWASPDSGATWPNRIHFEGGFLQIPHTSPTHEGQIITGFNCGDCINFWAPAHFDGVSNTRGNPWNNPTDVVYGNPWLIERGVYVQYAPLRAGSGTVLYLTTNAGATWASRAVVFESLYGTKANIAGPPANPTIYTTIYKGPNQIGLIKITGVRSESGTPKVIRADGDLVNIGTYSPGDGAWIVAAVVGVNPADPQHLIVADAGADQIKVSHDGGAHWMLDNQLTDLITAHHQLPFDTPGCSGSNACTQASVIAFDPTDSRRILVGTEAAGIIASLDGGLTWTKIPDSEKVTAITSFFFDEERDQIIFSSYGRGLWKLRGLPAASFNAYLPLIRR